MIVFYVALGGALGSVLRYIMVSALTHFYGTGFPYGTLAVNILGSFIMGALIVYLTRTLPHSMELRAFLAVGVLGGFTTFSAYSLDVITLFEEGQLTAAGIYAIGSVIFSITAVIAGMAIVRTIL